MGETGDDCRSNWGGERGGLLQAWVKRGRSHIGQTRHPLWHKRYREHSIHAVRWQMWWWEDMDVSLPIYSISLMKQAKSVAKWKKELLRKECMIWFFFRELKVINWLDKWSQLFEGHRKAHSRPMVTIITWGQSAELWGFISYIQPFMFRQAWDRWRMIKLRYVCVCVCVQRWKKK